MEKVEMTSLVPPDDDDYRLIIVDGDKDCFGYYLVKVVAFNWVTCNSEQKGTPMKKFEAIVGFDPDRAGEENYFYVRPGGDASIIVQVAVDYVEALQSLSENVRKGESEC